MNLEKVSMLSQKIEGVLGMVRTLKEENAKIKRELSQAQAVAQDKSLLLESAKNDLADCKAGKFVNLEFDILAKYVEKIAAGNRENSPYQPQA